MTFPRCVLTSLALIGLAATTPVHAASSAVTSASDSLSTSVEGMARSLKRSSTSSSPRVIVQGDYKVIQVAQLEGGGQEVLLQAVPGSGAQGEFTLRVSDKAAEQGGLLVGQVISARERPYGVEFARADTRTAFLLLLEDEWYRELKSVPVTL